MVKITMISYQFRPSLLEAVKKVNKVTNNVLDFKFYNTYDVDKELTDLDLFIKDLHDSDIVLIDVRGGDTVSKLIIDTLKDLQNTVVVFVGGSSEIIKLTRMGGFSIRKFSSLKDKPILRRFIKKSEIDYGKLLKMRERFEKIGSKFPVGIFRHARNYALLLKYYENPCVENYYGMFLLLLKEYGKVKIGIEIPEPKVLPSMGIQNFKTGEIFESLDEYLHRYKFKDRPLIGILFYGGFHYDQSYPAARLLTEKLEELGYGVIPVFCSDLRYYLAIEKFFFKNGKPIIETLADLLWFRFAGGPIGGDHKITLKLLSKLNVPILHGIHLSSRTVGEWKNSKDGISPIETVTTVILPELDGRNEPIVTHALKRYFMENLKIEEYVAIEDRVEKMAKRLAKWVELRKKKNSEKKIAIILYNYPPGEENLGKVAYLDAFESLAKLLKAMKERGYKITSTPTGKELKDMLISNGIVNSGEWVLTTENVEKIPKITVEEYIKWLKNTPNNAVNKVVKEWGPPPGQIMTYKNSILIPGILLGNVFIGLQPSRGVHEDPTKIYHDKDLPPHHQYIAFYKWIKHEFKADAIIHFGTHGTLEFLPGKEIGLSSECFPDILVDDLPNIYIYHAVNSSESSIAKRRIYAVIVNHASPPFTISDLHSDFHEIERLIMEYFDIKQYDKDKSEKIAKKIVEKAKKYNLGETIEEIYDRLQEYKRSLIPRGLHILGNVLSPNDTLNYLVFLSRYDRGRIKSIYRILCEARGLNYDEILANPHKRDSNGKLYSEILLEIEKEVKEIIKRYIIENKPVNILGLKVNKRELEEAISFLRGIYERILKSDEVSSVLNALEGKFIQPGPGGDFIRTPEIFPTGRNTYQLDPTNIPTEIAMERGEKIAEEYLEKFYKKYGRYPKTVSVVLWAFETMKTGGETVAAIFRLLGVKPVWKSIYIRDLEVIPISKLNRPRIDVVVTICGIFRDTFYNIVELLDKAFRKVASLDEPPELNYIKANVMEASKEYGEESLFRIFGPPEGQYATSLTSLIENSEWKSEADLIQAYLESMKFAYGEKNRNINAKELFNFMLSHVDIVAQIRDTVEYEITDLDHYYEFLGGLTKTVENARGSKPLVLVADTTREKIKVENAEDAVKRGVITRTINPKWLDSMLNHGYSGAMKIADRVEYMLGLAATLGGIQDWMWNKAAENIVFNKERSEKIKRENPWALRKVISRLLEAEKRGYWKADKETIRKLEEEYLQLEDILEENIYVKGGG